MLQMHVALGAMKLIRDGAVTGDLDAFGISPEDWFLTTGSGPWVGTDRQRVRATLDILVHGTVDVVGVPRFEVPSEYIAAVLAVFVGPTNMQLACRWMEGGSPAQVLAKGSSAEPPSDNEQVTARTLFALVCDIYEGEHASAARASFVKRTNLAIERSAVGLDSA